MKCLDSDILVFFLRENKAAILKINSLLLKDDAIATTSINLAELYRGAHKSKNPTSITRLNDLVSTIDIISFDKNSAELSGKLFAQLEKKGSFIGYMDILIAG